MPEGVRIAPAPGVYLTGGDTAVLAAEGDAPVLTMNRFGEGAGVYMASYRHSAENARMLQNLILNACGGAAAPWQSADPRVECALFPAAGRLVAVNNSGEAVATEVTVGGRSVPMELEAYGSAFVEV